MRFYQHCMAWIYALLRRGSQRSDGDKRSEAMLHNHDFESATSAFLGEVETYVTQATDPARAPRGILIAIGVALALWGSAIMAILALR
jgi:hypothetical protein